MRSCEGAVLYLSRESRLTGLKDAAVLCFMGC